MKTSSSQLKFEPKPEYHGLEELNFQVPEDIKIYVDLCNNIVDRVHDILEKKGITQRQLADSLDKYESEVSRWLSGDHNFTLRTIAKIQAFLGEKIIQIPTCTEQTIHPKIIYISYDTQNPFIVAPTQKYRAFSGQEQFYNHLELMSFIKLNNPVHTGIQGD